MSDYRGDDHAIALQKSIRARAAEIAENPLLANGGRILNVLNPAQYGWENIRKDVERDGYIALTMVERDAVIAELETEFGSDITYPSWEAFTGPPEIVLVACDAIIDQVTLPLGWRVESLTSPDDRIIDEVQKLNQSGGVAPAPAYYLRGEIVPSCVTCIWDDAGALAACATASMRYHPDGPLAGWLFAGGVTVSDAHRRKGLGSFVNAHLLKSSHAAHGWVTALEQARADNAASVGMIRRCGLARLSGRATIILNTTDCYVTR